VRRLPAGGAIACALAGTMAHAGEWVTQYSIAPEFRLFPVSTKRTNEDTVSPSIAFSGEFYYDTDSGDDRFVISPFVRLDADDGNRTLLDLTEAHWLRFGEGWDFLAGLNRVFWGVAESVHLVDIINQSDLAADVDGEDKLGQPMLNGTLYRDWGTLGLFVMSGFRERVFPDEDARLSAPLPIRESASAYDSSAERLAPELAIRYSQVFGDVDFGLSHFYGTSREPRLIPTPQPGGLELTPRYDTIQQTGLDVQLTRDATLYKLEAISRFGHGDWFGAFVGGFEHTLYQLLDSDADLGLLAEYQFDGRDDSAPVTVADNDLFLGSRLTLNDVQDTAVLAGTIVDTKNGSTRAILEAERRIGDDWKVELESRLFLIANDRDPTAIFRDDDLLTLRLTRYF